MTPGIHSEEVINLLTGMNEIILDRYRIAGEYVRFDDSVRNTIKDFKLKLSSSVKQESPGRESFLIWGAPGTGKSHLVHEIHKETGNGIDFLELNLARSGEAEFTEKLELLEKKERNVLCFVDEVDSKPNETWPYELLIPFMDPGRRSNKKVCFVLAGSSGTDIDEMKRSISQRPKGKDLLSRIFGYNEVIIPPLGAGDRILVATIHMVNTSIQRGIGIREVEKLALYYLSVNPSFSSPRQLSGIASACVQRMPSGEDRIKYDYLFSPGDRENKEFWLETRSALDKLSNKFVTVENAVPNTGKPQMELGRKRLAILPLVSISPEPADEYFADGLTEELIDRMCHVDDLAVIARTSVMNYKKEKKSISQIAGELKVDLILEGSVRKLGNRIRVTAQLINARTEEHEWSERYDRDLEDVFEVQSSVAENVVRTLKLRFSGQAGKVSEEMVDPETYVLFLRANQLVYDGTKESLREAKALYGDVIKKSPSFGRAYASLTNLLLRLANFEPDSEAAIRNIENAAKKSVELDPDSAYSRLAMGIVHFTFDRIEDSEREIMEALRINPNYAEALVMLGNIYWIKERVNDSVECLRKAVSLDPLSSDASIMLADCLRISGNVAGAVGVLESIQKIYPKAVEIYMALSRCYIQGEDFAKVDEILGMAGKLDPGSHRLIMEMGLLYSLNGRRTQAEEKLEELSGASEYIRLLATILIKSNLGDLDDAFGALEKMSSLHITPVNIMIDPMFGNLRKDPRFKEFHDHYLGM